MISDISDLAIWSRALYKGDLLTPNTQQARLEVQRGEGVSESSGYGEGISKLGKLWGHGGTIAGFSTDMWYLPEEDATIVISVNRCDETYINQSNYVLLPVLESLFPETVKDL
jgi:D-alanyl-D-alanine carboxypeptidase